MHCNKIAANSLIVMFAFMLASCSSTPDIKNEDISALAPSRAPEPVPKKERLSKAGNPKTYKVHGKYYKVKHTSRGFRERGLASWYGPKFHGRRTSSGERYDMHAVTAAHKTLPIPTYARVTRLDTGRSVVVRINDRGPFIKGRVIDLSYAAASKIGMLKQGTVPVEVVALSPYQHFPQAAKVEHRKAAATAKKLVDDDVFPAGLTQSPTPLPTPTADDVSAALETAPAPVQVDSADQVQQQPAMLAREPSETSAWERYYLQVGAFSQPQSAHRLQRHVTDAVGHPTTVSYLNGLHKVRIGPFEDRTEIDTLSHRLSAMGLEQLHVIYE